MICPEVVKPKYCVTFEAYEFPTQEHFLDIIIDILKTELPPRMAKIPDCSGNPMVIKEEHIGMKSLQELARFAVEISPISEVTDQLAGAYHRIVESTLEFRLIVTNLAFECVTWELMRFHAAVESLVMGANLRIDGYDSVDIEPIGFTYTDPGQLLATKEYIREGTLRVLVRTSQYRIDKG